MTTLNSISPMRGIASNFLLQTKVAYWKMKLVALDILKR